MVGGWFMFHHDFRRDPRFAGIKSFAHKVWLSSPTMHGDEIKYMAEAYKTNWMSTIGENIDVLEHMVSEYMGGKYAVALSSGTAALHLAIKLAAERLYSSSAGVSTPDGLGYGGTLLHRRVFCSDLTFAATVNPVVYEGGEPVFIDTETDTWNMDPKALKKGFELYPDTKLVIITHLYGVPGKMDEILEICREHGALVIEDAAESLGATYKNRQTGSYGDYGCISFNGNKIITGSSGGMFLCDKLEDSQKIRKWSTQSREAAPWYQHEELGYNYRMSNVIAGVIRGQFGYLKEHIEKKKKIYERYKKGLKDLPIQMNPVDFENSSPNYWLSAMIIDLYAMSSQCRSERKVTYLTEAGKTCPTEILQALEAFGAEGRPIWKPMHMQPIFRNHGYVTVCGSGRGASNAYITGEMTEDVGADIFERGVCLPSDNKMTEEEQDAVIEIIRRCFNGDL